MELWKSVDVGGNTLRANGNIVIMQEQDAVCKYLRANTLTVDMPAHDYGSIIIQDLPGSNETLAHSGKAMVLIRLCAQLV